MNEVVIVSTYGMAISMAAIVIAGTAAGLLLYWLDARADHGSDH